MTVHLCDVNRERVCRIILFSLFAEDRYMLCMVYYGMS